MSKTNNLVSVIMPSYNTGEFISKSIKSVQEQTYTNWELLIVDDCSDDNTDEEVNGFEDDRIHYFKNESNLGAAISRNRALRLAKGRWIAFLDSDDLWLPDKLEKQVSFMIQNQYAFSYTNYEEIDKDGKRIGIRVTGPLKITTQGMVNYCWPGCLTVMYDASKIGLIQIENIQKNNDYALWLKVCQIADCHLLNETLAYYRRGRSGSISNHRNLELVKWHYKLFHISEKQGFILSLINTMRNIVFGLYKKKKYVMKISNNNDCV